MGRFGGYGGYGDWAPYVPVASRIAKGRAAAKKLAKKERRDPCPVTIEGRKIAKTFWGLKWCENLQRYQDFANRLPRGATYVRNGSVADLVIESGRVRSVVGGSSAYTVDVEIETLQPKLWKAIGRDCASQIDSLLDLLQGRFSDGVMERLTQAQGGLFPEPAEISMRCSCPDYAFVCKHIAATLYGVAARLDAQPELLFQLRNVDHLELIGQAADAASLDQALRSDQQAVLSDDELGDIFGIELESAEQSSPAQNEQNKPQRKRGAKRAVKDSAEETTKPKKKKPAARKKPAKKKTAKKKTAKKATAKKKAAKKKTTKTKSTKKQVAKKKSAKKKSVKKKSTKTTSTKRAAGGGAGKKASQKASKKRRASTARTAAKSKTKTASARKAKSPKRR